MLDYKVIATGSTGNAVKIENIMIDCGIKFDELEPYLFDVDYLLITHKHGDHVKKTTLNKIRRFFPQIHIVSNYEVAQYFPEQIDSILSFDNTLMLSDTISVKAFECVHDVVCSGYVIDYNGLTIIYATDTNTLHHAPTIKYDYLFLEANYDEHQLKIVNETKKKYGYNVLEGMLRHLSIQDCKAFYYMNRRSKDSPLIQLHQSSRFY